MTGGVTQEQVRNVRRAIQDPMIGGWPLIHWEWVFSTDQHALGVEVIGEWPDNEARRVTLRYHPGSGRSDRLAVD